MVRVCLNSVFANQAIFEINLIFFKFVKFPKFQIFKNITNFEKKNEIFFFKICNILKICTIFENSKTFGNFRDRAKHTKFWHDMYCQ